MKPNPKKDRDEITVAKSIFDEIVEFTENEETSQDDEITVAKSLHDEIVEETESSNG